MEDKIIIFNTEDILKDLSNQLPLLEEKYILSLKQNLEDKNFLNFLDYLKLVTLVDYYKKKDM